MSSSIDIKEKNGGSMKKHNAALNEISLNFTSFLQEFMRDSGYDFDDTEVFSCSFIFFMRHSLFHLSQLLTSLKSNINHEFTEEEQVCMHNIYCQNKLPEIGYKMAKAIKIMKTELTQKIKRCMIDESFEQSETTDSHNAYVSIVSKTLLSETGKMLRFKERYRYSGHSDVVQNQSGSHDQKLHCSPSNDIGRNGPSLPHGKESSLSRLDLTSMRLIVTTAKHNIYHDLAEKVVMKVLKITNASSKNIRKLDNELNSDKILYHPSIRRSLRRSVFKNEQALFLEWAPGVPLSQMESLDPREFLRLAREIICPILEMHANHMMHMNLSCDHIIFNNESKSIQIISCGSFTLLNNHNHRTCLSKDEILEKDLRFISPEQSGRVNRYVDHRSDFYSLGIVFYKLLTGKYPFESENKLNLLHMHIFEDPIPACSIDPNIPVIVSDMISKLIAKNAEDRYQTAKGIVHDLDLMISEYDTDNKLSSIILAQHDASETLLLPQKLYGRSTECNALLASFGRISRSFEVVMIAGDSGTGKSALAFELYNVMAQKDGIVIKGKYNFSESEPYSAFLIAFNNFCEELLLKDALTIANCKSRIRDAVGQEGRILASFITNLHLIIGQQPDVSDAFGQVAKNRFHHVFVKLIKATCSIGFPFVLILEDLQWMDVESLSLLSALVTDKSIKNLLLVGTYRENETSDAHPVKVLINNLKKSSITLTQIRLDNFHHETLNEFISDALCIPFHEAYALTAMFMEKTNGNPFFVNQMIRSLSEKGLIFFSNDSWKWKWDPAIFGENDISKSVQELLRLNILALCESTQQVLKVASCLKSSFSHETLKLIVNRSDAIERALSTGMITQQNGSDRIYRFVHDETQMAAFSLLPEDPREIFLYIGKKLWTLYSRNDLDVNIFLVTHLLRNAVDLISNQTERSKVAELFLLAGNKAIISAAFTKAYEHLEVGIKMLNANYWKSDYDLSLKLHNSFAKAAYCKLNYSSLIDCMEAILTNALSALDTVQVYSLKIKYFNDRRKFQDALDTAMSILNKIGENVNHSQSKEMLKIEVEKVKSLLHGKTHREISEMKEMEDEYKIATMSILSEILPCAHFINRQLSFHIALRMVHLTLKYGVSKFSSFGFCALGAGLCNDCENLIDTFPYQLGKLSIILLENADMKELVPWCYVCFYGLIHPFFASIHDSIDPFLHAYRINLEIGSYHGATLCVSSYCAYSFLSGEKLTKIKECIDKVEDELLMKIKTHFAIHQAILNLLGENERNPAILSGHIFDYKSIDDGTFRECDVVRIYVTCCMVAYLFHDYASCLKFAKNFRPFIRYITNVYHYPIMLFFESLVLLEEDKEIGMEVVMKNIDTLKIMSNNAPENYSNKVSLLEAELAVVRNDRLKAKTCFTEAITLSRKHGFIHEEALAYEREGLFLLKTDSLDAAKHSLLNAYHCYEKWGAIALSKALIKNHPGVFDGEKLLPFKTDNSILQIKKDSGCSVSLLTETSFGSKYLKRKRVTFKM